MWVFKLALLALIPAALGRNENGLAVSYLQSEWWTGQFSEEGGGWSQTGPFRAMNCYGSYCDNKALYRFGQLKVRDREGHWRYPSASTENDDSHTSPFSEEQGTRECPQGKVVYQVQCRGRYCDDMVLNCRTPRGWYVDTHDKMSTGHYSEEHGAFWCSSNYAITGLKCSGRYCDNVALICARVYAKDDNNCSPDPCVHGSCQDLWQTNYRCNCQAGYNAKNCDNDIDECSSSPCRNGGTCTDKVNAYQCSCTDEYEGNQCQLRTCPLPDNADQVSQIWINGNSRTTINPNNDYHITNNQRLEQNCPRGFFMTTSSNRQKVQQPYNVKCNQYSVGWESDVSVECALPEADLQFSGRSLLATMETGGNEFQMFDVEVKKVEFDLDGSLITEVILSQRVTGYNFDKVLVTDHPGMKERLQGATFYQIGYSFHGDSDNSFAWTEPDVTNCGCSAPHDLADENVFFSHHPGCFKLPARFTRFKVNMEGLDFCPIKILGMNGVNEGANVKYDHAGTHNGKPYYRNTDEELYIYFMKPSGSATVGNWVIGRLLGGSQVIARVRQDSRSPEDITQTWEVYDIERDAFVPQSSTLARCIFGDEVFSDPGVKVVTLSNNSNGRCAKRCREYFPAASYTDLYASTIAETCFCSTSEPSDGSLLTTKCDTSCPGQSTTKCGHDDANPDELAISVFRANTFSNNGFLTPHTYAGVSVVDDQERLAFSGAPRNFKVHQKQGGIIYFTFQDSSTCEDRFEYFRVGSPWDEYQNLLDFDLELVTKQQCGYEYTVEVLETAGPIEDPVAAYLRIGRPYEFKLRTNTANINAEGYVSTSTVSYVFTPYWEAFLTGKVKTRSSAPVSDVRITVTLPGPYGKTLDPVYTDKSGTYQIWLHGDYDEYEQNVVVTPYLEMHGIEHQFECGRFGLCTEISHPLKMDTKLSSLQKEAQTLNFVDMTVVDIKGTVYVQEPLDTALICPERDVRVCVHYIHPARQLNQENDCVTTGQNGKYNLQVPIFHGTLEISAEKVRVDNPHRFVSQENVQQERILLAEKTFDRPFINQNFLDVTSRRIHVDVYGGTSNCKADILQWKVAAVPKECPTFEHAVFLDRTVNPILLGAQEYTLQFIGEDAPPGKTGSEFYDLEMAFSMAEIFTYFEFYQPKVNLTDVDPTASEDFLFEYHLPATMTVTDLDDEAVNSNCPNSLDFITLEHGETYNLTVSVAEVFSTEVELDCKDVAGRLNIFGLPQRGPDPPTGCADPSTGFHCFLDVTYDEQDKDSKVKFAVTPTSPSMTLKYLALDYIANIKGDTFEDIAAKRLVKPVFVIGTRKLEPGTQVPLPEHVPLLILREPPGDASFSSISKGSTLSITMAVQESYTTEGEIAIKLGFGGESETSVGIGVEKEVHKVEGEIGGVSDTVLDHGTTWGGSATLNLELSETFSTPGGGGTIFGDGGAYISKSETDMFLTPAFNLEINEAQIFELSKDDDGNCQQNERRHYAWSLPDELLNYETDQNVASNLFSWYSEYHIRHYKLPELQRMVDTHDVNCPEGCLVTKDCDVETLGQTCYDQDCLGECPLQKRIIQDALTGWNDTLNENQRLKDGALALSAASRLSDDSHITPMVNTNHKDLRTQYGLPFKFAGDAIIDVEGSEKFGDKLDTTVALHYPASFSEQNTIATPGGIHQLSFSGGGGAYEYSYTSGKDDSYDLETESSFSQKLGLWGVIKFNIAGIIPLDTEAEFDLLFSSAISSGRNFGVGHGYTTTFTLQDDDFGDDFTVDVLEDENGWLYFHTIGGKSSCPHEFNTTSRQSYTLSLNLATGDSADVYGLGPDDFVTWDLVVANESPTGDTYSMSLAMDDNDGLILEANGAPFEMSEYGIYIGASESATVRVTGRRPVGTKDDFNVAFAVGSSCEPYFPQGISCTAHFIKNCPAPRFAKDDPWILADDGTLELVAVNDLWRTNPWGPTSQYKYQKVKTCDVAGSTAPFSTLSHGEERVVTCEVECSSGLTSVIGCPKDSGLVNEDSSICKAAKASGVMNNFGEILVKKTLTTTGSYTSCTEEGITTTASDDEPDKSFIFTALPDDPLIVKAHFRTLSPFGTMPWSPFIDFNFAHFPLNKNGRTAYTWTPSVNVKGDLELELVTACGSDYATNRGRSPVWPGNIDRDPPEVVPYPEPQDGLYERGDAIAFQFNEPIVCDFSDLASTSNACVKANADPATDCQDIIHSVWCPNHGEDGRVNFLIPRLDDYSGEFIEIKVGSIIDKHGRKSNFPDPWTFQVSAGKKLLLSIPQPSATATSSLLSLDDHEIILSEISPSRTAGPSLEFNEDQTKMRLGDFTFSEVEYTFGEMFTNFDALKNGKSVDCFVEYTLSVDEELRKGHGDRIEILRNNNANGGSDGWDFDGPNEQLFRSPIDCHDEHQKITFRFESDLPEASKHIWLHTKLEIGYQQASHHHYRREISDLLGIASERVQKFSEDIEGVALLSLDESDEISDYEEIMSFEICESEDGIGPSLKESVKIIEHAMSNSQTRQLYPLTLSSQISYDLIVEPKACDGFETPIPHIVAEKSKMVSMEYLQVVIHAGAQFSRLQFAFEGAPDSSARFEYVSGSMPLPSGFWQVSQFDRCTTEFVFTLPWSHMDEFNVLGHEDINGNGLKYEASILVESWEMDIFGEEFLYEDDVLIFDMTLEGVELDVEVRSSHLNDINILKTEARIGEGVHIEFENSEIVDPMTPVRMRTDYQHYIVNLAKIEEATDNTSEIWSLDISAYSGCEIDDEVEILFANVWEEDVVIFDVKTSSLCPEVERPPCLTSPSIANANNITLSACGGTKSDASCQFSCAPGFIPSDELQCSNGKWINEPRCEEKYFLIEPRSFSSSWIECAEQGGHLATIESFEENEEIRKVCSSSNDLRCFIGLYNNQRESGEMQWIDSSEFDFTHWKDTSFLEQPPTQSDDVAYMHSTTGQWQITKKENKLSAVCEKSPECIPSTEYRFVSPENVLPKIEISACSEISHPAVQVTNGCDLINVEPKIDTKNSKTAKSEATIYRTWKYGSAGPVISQVVEVVNEAPVFLNDVSDEVVSCSDVDNLEIPEMFAKDKCDGLVEVKFSETKSSNVCPYVLVREWIATDSDGNSSLKQQVIRVSE